MQTGQKDWVRKNKKAIINDIISDSEASPDGTPRAIFMAGLPGAGKTEFTKGLNDVTEARFVRLDMDEIAGHIQGYEPQIADQYREAATSILNDVFSEVLKRGLDFIMDGTFSSRYAALDVERVRKHGYNIRIIYLQQDPRLAWKFTLAREKVEHRAIKIDGFVNAYFNTISNIQQIMEKNSDIIKLDFVTKNSENQVGKWYKNISLEEFNKTIENNFTKESLKEYIND